MAALQFSGSVASRKLRLFEGFRPLAVRIPSVGLSSVGLNQRCFPGLVVKAATVVSPKYTSIKPLGDRVLVKIKTVDEKTTGGILLPSTAQTKPQAGEVVAVGEGKTIGKSKVDISVQTGAQVVYSKYAGTEVEFYGSKHLLFKDDDIVGILETEDIKDLKPLNDRVLIKVAEVEEKTVGGLLLTEAAKEKPSIGTVAEVEEKTVGGLLLTEAAKEKPSIGTVIAVGPGPFDGEGNRKPLMVAPGETVMYSSYAGNDFKGSDGEYIALRASDVMAVLS